MMVKETDENKCKFCSWAFDEDTDDDLEDLIKLPLTIGSDKYDVKIGQFDVWIDSRGQLSAGLAPTNCDYIDISRKTLNFCPMCGRDFRIYRKGEIIL